MAPDGRWEAMWSPLGPTIPTVAARPGKVLIGVNKRAAEWDDGPAGSVFGSNQ